MPSSNPKNCNFPQEVHISISSAPFNIDTPKLFACSQSDEMPPSNQEIKGKALKVYLYLLKNGPSQLRDIQRGTELSSPSLASYHLSKLIDSGFVKQDKYGMYLADKENSQKVLEGYQKIGKSMVPQLFFFSLLFTILAGFFSFAALFWEGYAPFLVAVCISLVAILWFETIRVWRKLSL
jgi:hypothetical protein